MSAEKLDSCVEFLGTMLPVREGNKFAVPGRGLYEKKLADPRFFASAFKSRIFFQLNVSADVSTLACRLPCCSCLLRVRMDSMWYDLVVECLISKDLKNTLKSTRSKSLQA